MTTDKHFKNPKSPQHALIEQLYPNMTAKEVAKQTGLSYGAVTGYIYRHKLLHTPEFTAELKRQRVANLAAANRAPIRPKTPIPPNNIRKWTVSRLRTILRADRQNELDMPPSRRITELLIAITDLIHDLETLNQKTQ